MKGSGSCTASRRERGGCKCSCVAPRTMSSGPPGLLGGPATRTGDGVMRRTLILTTPMCTGEDVKFAQQVLKRRGDYEGEIDGEFGILSAQASRQAQFELGYARPRAGFGTPLEKLLTRKATPTAAMKARSAQRKKEIANQKALRKR